MIFACGSAAAQINGLLYGVTNGTENGLPNGFGDIYSFNPTTNEVISIHDFSKADGSSMEAALTFLSDGYFYGTARYGGATDNGTIFKLKPDGTGFQVIYNFKGGIDGNDPLGGLVAFCDGFLYGSTIQGGAGTGGIFYRIGTDGTSFQKVIDFDNVASGFSPRGKPTLIGDVMFLVNGEGGTHNQGTIIMIHADGSYKKVIDFDGPTMGGFPNAALIQASNGLLYGVASSGGTNNAGTIFRLSADGSGFTKLFDFSQPLGEGPIATLMQSSAGVLFGTTFGGGVNFPEQEGVLFKINLDGTNFTKLHDFGSAGDGAFTDGGLVESNGMLIGLALEGGANNLGAIYTVNPDGSGYQKVYDFTADLTGTPRYNLVPAVSTSPPSCNSRNFVVCKGMSVLLTVSDTVNRTFLWSTGQTTPKITVTESGAYSVSVYDTTGKLVGTYQFVVTTVNPPKAIQLGDDEVLCTVPSEKLIALVDTTGYTVTWQDQSTFSSYNVTDFGKYWVTVSNSCGAASDTISFTKPVGNQSFIPNVITPNNDGFNEVFLLESALAGSDVLIVNRWGKKVYTSADYQNDWDGEGLSTGVFYYLIRDRCGNVYKGPVSILR